jgi:hypothetical protein
VGQEKDNLRCSWDACMPTASSSVRTNFTALHAAHCPMTGAPGVIQTVRHPDTRSLWAMTSSAHPASPEDVCCFIVRRR